MLKKTVTYEDYDSIVRTEDHYFNLTESELTMMEMSEVGGYQKRLESMVQSKDSTSMIQVIHDFVKASYGQKSPDGKRFIKSSELYEEFSQTEAYNKIFMELLTDDNAAIEFVIGVLPKSIGAAVREKMLEEKDENASIPATVE